MTKQITAKKAWLEFVSKLQSRNFHEYLDDRFVLVPKDQEPDTAHCISCNSETPLKDLVWGKCPKCKQEPVKKIEIAEPSIADSPIASHDSLVCIAKKLNEVIDALNTLL